MNAITEPGWMGIAEDWCQAVNAWMSARPNGVCKLPGRTLEFQWTTNEDAAFTVHAMFECLGYRWGIALDSLGAFDERLKGMPFMCMPEIFRTLTVEKLLAEAMKCLPIDIARNLDAPVIGWGKPAWPSSWHKLPVLLRNHDQRTVSLGVFAVESPDGLIWLNQNLPLQPGEKKTLARSQLHCHLPVTIGETRLAIQEIKQLEEGDLIWIETARITRKGMRVFLKPPMSENMQSCIVYHGFIKQRNLILCGTSTTKPNSERLPLHLPLATDTENAMEMDIGNIELPLTFDLGAITLPINEIERLGEHQILELSSEAANMCVNVRVHGTCIAQGSLMLVGRRLAVRLEKVGMADVTEPRENVSSTSCSIKIR